MGVEAFGWLAAVDVTGFGFFAAQVGVLTVAALGWGLTRHMLLRRRAHRAGGDRIAPGNLHPIELAYVTGGADHAVLVAYVGLHERGDLVPAAARQPVAAADGEPGGAVAEDAEDDVDPGDIAVDIDIDIDVDIEIDVPAVWEVRAGDATGTHPVERAVIEAVRDGRQVPESLLRLRLSEAMGSLHERLATQGLIVDDRLRRQVRLAGLWLAPTIVVALGGALGAQGLRRDSLAYFGFGLVLVGAAVVALLTYEVPRTTPAGSRVIAEARKPYLVPAADLDHDPRAVASLGPVRTWKVAPQVPAAFGFPRPRNPKP